MAHFVKRRFEHVCRRRHARSPVYSVIASRDRFVPAEHRMITTPSETRSDVTPFLDRLLPLPDPVPRSPDSQSAIVIIGFLALIMSTVIWSVPPLPRMFNAWIYATFFADAPGWLDRLCGFSGAVNWQVFSRVLQLLLFTRAVHVLQWVYAQAFVSARMRVSCIQFDRLFRVSISRREEERVANGSASMIPIKSDKLMPSAGLRWCWQGP